MTLDDVQAGDKLILNNGRYCKILIVDRVTPTMIVAGGVKYAKKTGEEVGYRSTWNPSTISVATDELIAEIKEEEYRQQVINSISEQCTKLKLREQPTWFLTKLFEVLENDG